MSAVAGRFRWGLGLLALLLSAAAPAFGQPPTPDPTFHSDLLADGAGRVAGCPGRVRRVFLQAPEVPDAGGDADAAAGTAVDRPDDHARAGACGQQLGLGRAGDRADLDAGAGRRVDHGRAGARVVV